MVALLLTFLVALAGLLARVGLDFVLVLSGAVLSAAVCLTVLAQGAV